MITPRMQLCLDKAHECERLAEQATDRIMRYDYLDLARLWRELAEDDRTLREPRHGMTAEMMRILKLHH
jgi:hypothetical protein